MIRELGAEDIVLSYSGRTFSGIKAGPGIIGQERALGLLRLGLSIDRIGYNIFISGDAGQGTGSEGGQGSETTVYVSSAEELKTLGTVAAGTVVVWRNGLYSDQVAELKSAGTAENPVILRAEKPGAVCLEPVPR